MKRGAPRKLWTDDELLALPGDGHDFELIDGVLHDMSPGGPRHGAVIVRLSAILFQHVERGKLGIVYDGQTGYRLDLDNCISPDVSFVSKERIATLAPDPDKFLMGAPDFAVEVLSPSDSWRQVERKIELFLRFGTRLAWIIDPKRSRARVYSSMGECREFTGEFELTGEPVLPGFKISSAEIFGR